MNTLLALQARVSSTRLPGKVLLPIKSIPLVVLAAKRAMRGGLPLVILTSKDSSDNPLVEVARDNNLDVYRGSLDNPLERFYFATKELDDEDNVVRLTSDNVFPDHDLITEMLNYFLEKKLEFICSSFVGSNLAYGVSVEIMKVKKIREAYKNAKSDMEKEHVTLWIKNNSLNCKNYLVDIKKNFSGLRATIDTFFDYISVSSIFEEVVDPIDIKWDALCEILYKKHKINKEMERFALGTVQFGMRYGINATHNQPNEKETLKIINKAVVSGIKIFDTARVYGNSENRLGKSLYIRDNASAVIITKLPSLTENGLDNTYSSIKNFIDANVCKSCYELNRSNLDVLLLHRATDISLYKGQVWQYLINLCQEGLIKKLGVSIQNIEELLLVIDDPYVKLIQLPFNLLDWRWRDKNIRKKILNRKDIEIHARSVLLQGVLADSPVENWPILNQKLKKILHKRIEFLIKRFSRKSRIDLAIAYVKSQSWIQKIILGVHTFSQLEDNLIFMKEPALSAEQCEELEETLPRVPEQFLNPRYWRKNFA